MNVNRQASRPARAVSVLDDKFGPTGFTLTPLTPCTLASSFDRDAVRVTMGTTDSHARYNLADGLVGRYAVGH